MDEERRMILKMVEEGKITGEEAAALLEALDEHGEKVVISPGEASGPAAKDERPDQDESADWKKGAKAFAFHRGEEGLDEGAFEEIGRRAEHFSERVSKAAEELGERLGRLGEELGERVPNTIICGLGDVFSLAPGHHLEESVDGTFGDGPVEIELRNANGSMSISGWDNEGYRLVLSETVRGRSEEEARRRVSQAVRLQRDPQSLRFEAAGEHALNVRLQLMLPRTGRYRINVKSSNGNIIISNIDIDEARLGTANGRIQLDGVSGNRLEMGSTNGRIEGSVHAGDLSAKTTNGRVELELQGRPGGRYHIKTINGRIELAVPENWPCDLDAANNFGSLQTDMNGLTYRERVVGTEHPRMKASRPGQGETSELMLRSTCGSIRVRDNAPEGGGQ